MSKEDWVGPDGPGPSLLKWSLIMVILFAIASWAKFILVDWLGVF